MSDQGSDLEELGAHGPPASPSFPCREEMEALEKLHLEEKAVRPKAKWSLGVGREQEAAEVPSGVTVRRHRRERGPEQKAEEGDPRLSQVMKLLAEMFGDRQKRGGVSQEIPRQEEPEQLGRGMQEFERETEGQIRQMARAASASPPPQGRGRNPTPRLRIPKIPALGLKYGGESKALGFFLVQVDNYMARYEDLFADEADKVRQVTLALEGDAAEWMTGLHNDNDPKLGDLNQFMAALRARFEDPLAEQRAKTRIKTMRQGRRSVAEYTQEFRNLAQHVHDWSQATLMEFYRDGLTEIIYEKCLDRGAPRDLLHWYALAEKVELDHAKNRRWSQLPPPGLGDPQRTTRGGPNTKPRTTACFKCGKEGHRAANCFSKSVAKPTITAPKPGAKFPGRTPPKPRETVLEGVEIVKSTPTNQEEPEVQTPTKDPEWDSDDEPGVSHRTGPLLIPIELQAPSSPSKGKMLALLDSGCTRCVISPEVTEKLGLKLRNLKTPIAFCQLDGSVAGGQPARFTTEPVQMSMGGHRELLSFIVAPGMDRPLILGMPWLRKWNPRINWRTGVLKIRSTTPKTKGIAKAPPTGQGGETAAALSEYIEGEDKIPKQYRDLKKAFSERGSDQLPPHRPTDCSIEILPGVKLPKPKMYAMAPRELEELRLFIDKNLKRGFIQPAKPRVAAPVLFREKKDGSLRLVVDYRNLNAICVENVYPLPLMKDMLAHLSKGKIFTKLDLREAYYRVRIKEGDEWKTAFNCPLGCYQFKVLPFGLQGAPAVFMQLINEVLHDHLYKGVLVYLDDILIYTETMEEHIKLVRSVLKKLRAAELYAKLSKCEFHQSKIDYLGYRISHEGVEMDPEKVRAVLDWAPPRTRKQLQSFLGFANFYRQFIPSFANIALPITNLLKTKGEVKPKPSQPLNWTMECQAAFEKLKKLFAAEPVLKHPDPNIPFVIQADASDVAVGAVLLQNNSDGDMQPCAYTSRKLTETERRWAIWEKEAFAVRWALLTWRHFLEGARHPFEVWTDHKNLEALKTPRKLTPKQVRWAQYFNRFNFSLRYIPGGKNFMADALSRLPQYNSKRQEVIQSILPSKQLAIPAVTRAQKTAAITVPTDLHRQIREALEKDEWFLAHKHECTMKDGLAWIGEKIYIPTALRTTILERGHDSKIAGHFGFVKTLHLLKRQFHWPSIKKDIENYVASCPVCASAKRPPGKPVGLLQNVAKPTAPWKEISMDFIVELPESSGNTVIWVVTDLFSKQVHFVPCAKIPSAKTLAKLFIQHVYRPHGVPERIISDRGVQFTSQFWREFLKLIGSSQGLSSAHHPQTNGACERTNSVLEQYLRCYVNYQQDNWAELLPFAEVAYNNSVHSSTGFTPFKIVYGLDFVPIPELPHETPTIPSLSDWITQLQQTWPVTRKALDDAHQAHKKQADKKRAPQKEFKVGDRVFLSTKHLQTTQQCKKLGPKYVGPFPVVKIINPVSVQLQLPKSLRRIHPVFHVNLLKHEITSDLRPSQPNPPVPLLIEGEQHFEVKEILDSRNQRGKLQYLVAWKHFPPSHAEWVDARHVRAPKLVDLFHSKYPNKP